MVLKQCQIHHLRYMFLAGTFQYVNTFCVCRDFHDISRQPLEFPLSTPGSKRLWNLRRFNVVVGKKRLENQKMQKKSKKKYSDQHLAFLLCMRIMVSFCHHSELRLILRLSSRQTRRHWRVFAPNCEPKMQHGILNWRAMQSDSCFDVGFLAHFPLQNLLLSIELVGARPTRSKIWILKMMLSRFLESLLNWESVSGLCVRQFPRQNESDFRKRISVHLLRCKFSRDDFRPLFGGVVTPTLQNGIHIYPYIHIWWWNLGRGNLTRKNTGQESLRNEA